MARQKAEDSLFYFIFRLLPTWAVVASVATIYIVLRFIAPVVLHGNIWAQFSIIYALPLTAITAIIALFAEADKHKRRALLATQSSLETLRGMTWQNFELLVGEAYRRQGYAVEEKGGRGPDGGVDLVLRREGQTTLVQCKRWKQAKVGAPVVRELRGAVARNGASRGIFVTCGQFTQEARTEGQGQPPLELVDGPALLALVQQMQGKSAFSHEKPAAVETPTPAAVPTLPAAPPVCPKCGASMRRRTARSGANAGSEFWGCPSFPRCRGTRSTN